MRGILRILACQGLTSSMSMMAPSSNSVRRFEESELAQLIILLEAETVKTWEKFFCEAHLIPSFLNRSLSARPLRPEIVRWNRRSRNEPPFGSDQRIAQSVNLAIHLCRIRNRAPHLLA